MPTLREIEISKWIFPYDLDGPAPAEFITNGGHDPLDIEVTVVGFRTLVAGNDGEGKGYNPKIAKWRNTTWKNVIYVPIKGDPKVDFYDEESESSSSSDSSVENNEELEQPEESSQPESSEEVRAQPKNAKTVTGGLYNNFIGYIVKDNLTQWYYPTSSVFEPKTSCWWGPVPSLSSAEFTQYATYNGIGVPQTMCPPGWINNLRGGYVPPGYVYYLDNNKWGPWPVVSQ
jgi:hypothetical protein